MGLEVPNFGQGFHLHLFFMYASSESSGELDTVFSTMYQNHQLAYIFCDANN